MDDSRLSEGKNHIKAVCIHTSTQFPSPTKLRVRQQPSPARCVNQLSHPLCCYAVPSAGTYLVRFPHTPHSQLDRVELAFRGSRCGFCRTPLRGLLFDFSSIGFRYFDNCGVWRWLVPFSWCVVGHRVSLCLWFGVSCLPSIIGIYRVLVRVWLGELRDFVVVVPRLRFLCPL